MMGLFTFELYLLSRMRAASKVDETLQRLNATRLDAERAAAAAEEYGFEEPGHSAQLYRDVLGAPVSSEPDLSLGPDSPFAGSTVLRFGLPVWPGFEFVVREHPAGYAWGGGFDRAKGVAVPPLRGLADLRPWQFVEAEVTAGLGRPFSVDAWSGWEDLCYTVELSPEEPPRRYLLQFDLNLFQTISPYDGAAA